MLYQVPKTEVKTDDNVYSGDIYHFKKAQEIKLKKGLYKGEIKKGQMRISELIFEGQFSIIIQEDTLFSFEPDTMVQFKKAPPQAPQGKQIPLPEPPEHTDPIMDVVRAVLVQNGIIPDESRGEPLTEDQYQREEDEEDDLYDVNDLPLDEPVSPEEVYRDMGNTSEDINDDELHEEIDGNLQQLEDLQETIQGNEEEEEATH